MAEKNRKKRAFSVLEYAFLLVMIVAVLVLSFHYLKQAICGRMKSSADVFGFGRQYQP
jgi:Flp pilus assembly pilin Flp